MTPSSHAQSRARAARGAALAVVAFGALAGVALAGAPVALAADPSAQGAGSGASDAGAADGSPSAKPALKKTTDAGISKIPPDPPPMSARGQWVFDLRYDKGDLYLLGVHEIDLGAPQPTPRAMGRFALELYEGPTLVERVRFDFPFLGAGELAQDAGNRYAAPPKFEPKVTTRIGVMFPSTTRGTRLELWDRATDQRWPMPWPPEATRPHATTGRGATISDGG
jgi:hypothetical protein